MNKRNKEGGGEGPVVSHQNHGLFMKATRKKEGAPLYERTLRKVKAGVKTGGE